MLSKTKCYITIACRSLSKVSYKHNIGEEPLRYITVGALLRETEQKYGDRKAIIAREQKTSLTFKELLTKSTKLAAGFQKLGLKKKDRVGVWLPNLIEWYIVKMACAQAGLLTVALNPAYQPPEMEYCINKVNVKAIVCTDTHRKQNYYEHLETLALEVGKSVSGRLKSSRIPSLQTVITVGSSKSGFHNFEEVLDLASHDDILKVENNEKLISPDEPCNLHFTSGTTGKPKAALVSHFALVNNGYFIGKGNELSLKHHTICIQVPLFHAFGTVIGIIASLCHGSTLVVPAAGYDPDKSLDAIKEEKCTMIYGTPTMYVDLVQKQAERKEPIYPEIAVSGGALCSEHLFEQMLKTLHVKKVKSMYGLTEVSAVAFQSLWTETKEKSLTTVGHLGEHLEAKVLDKGNNIVPFGTAGELCIRGYSTMLGYWEDEEKTKEIMSGDGWLRTGDQFILEEDGYGRVVGRLKDMIIRGGENIYPKEIEDLLNTHPSVLEAQVVGHPHERLGEEVYACIRTKPGCALTLQDVAGFCKGRLARFKIPSKLKILDSFPRTESGKIEKYKLRQMLLEERK